MKKIVLAVVILALMVTLAVAVSAEGTHEHCVCGVSHESIGDHTATEMIAYTPWDGSGSITYTRGVAYLYLTNDVTLSESITIGNGQTLYLCLNGHSIVANGSEFSAFNVFKGTLVASDCGTEVRKGHVDTSTGLWTEGEPNDETDVAYDLVGGVIRGFSNRQGAAVYVGYGQLTMYNVNVCGNTQPKSANYYEGGAIQVAMGATAKLYNVTVSGNVSQMNGGGVMQQGGTSRANTLTMIGCAIEYNTAAREGGGVHICDGTSTIENCTIRGNHAGSLGGGIYMDTQTNTMKDCVVTQNTADSTGGGFYYRMKKMELSGNIKIIGNTCAGVANNLYFLLKDYPITIGTSGLSEGSKIGVTSYSAPTEKYPWPISNENTADYSAYFVSDNWEAYHIVNDESNNAIKLAVGETVFTSAVTTTTAEGGTVAINLSTAKAGETVSFTVNPDANYAVGTVTVTGESGAVAVSGPDADGNYSFTMPIEAVTINATFIPIVSYNVWFGNVQLASNNLVFNSSNCEAITSGSVTFDPENNMLVLDNVTYSGEGSLFTDGDYEYRAIVNTELNLLTIKLVGENSFTVSNTDVDDFFASGKNLIITGDDKTRNALSIQGADVGIDVSDLVIESATVSADSDLYGYWYITIDDSTVTSRALIAINEIAIKNGSTVTANTVMCVNSLNEIIVDNSTLTVNDVVVWDGLPFSAGITATAVSITNGSKVTVNNQNTDEGMLHCGIVASPVMEFEAGYFGGVTIDANCEVEIYAKDSAILNPDNDEGLAPIFNGDVTVFAGDTAASATKVATPVDETYASQYVRIVPGMVENTVVTHTVAPTFTVSIPARVELGGEITVAVEDVVIKKGTQVEISLTNANGFRATTAEGAEIIYTVKNGEVQINEGDTVLTVNPETESEGSTTLNVLAPESIQFAGDYRGTISFTIAVKAAENNG